MIYHSIRRVWFIFLFQLSAIALVAQDSTSRHVWTLKECIEYAKTNNININTAVLSSRISSQNYLQSQAAVLPNIAGAGSYSAVYANKDGTNRKVTSTGSVGLSSSIVVYNGGYLRNDIKQKNLEIESANLSVLENT